MKSKLFSSFDPKKKDNEEFIKDLNILMNANSEQRDLVLQSFPLLYTTKIDKDKETIIRDLSEKTKLNRLEIGGIVAFLSFLVSELDDERLNIKEDTPDTWTSDLLALDILEDKWKSDFANFIRSVKNKIENEILPQKKKDVFQSGILPYWRGIGTTVELRGVFDKIYDFGDSIDGFLPNLTTVVPIISVSITISRGEHETFGFQIPLAQLNLFIASLEAAKKQAIILQDSYTRESSKKT